MTDDEVRFQLAANAARRLVSQCLAHAERVSSRASDRLADAAPASPFGVDQTRALSGEHPQALKQMLDHLEAASNALVSHLAGLKRLLDDETFHPLPAMVIARSIAEVASSCVWMLGPGLSPDDRTARAYAAMFLAVQSSISTSTPDDAARMTKLRDELILELDKPGAGVQVVLRVRDGVAQDDVAQIIVGRSPTRARAKVQFAYSQRVRDEIPSVSGLYSAMSGVVHGEHVSITTSWNTPDAFARVIGHVAAESTQAWSRAVHDWVGVTPVVFLNEVDRQNILLSIPEATRLRVEARFAAILQARAGKAES